MLKSEFSLTLENYKGAVDLLKQFYQNEETLFFSIFSLLSKILISY